MPDDLERRLREVLATEAARLPFHVDARAVRARLERPRPRSTGWVTGIAAAGAAAAVVGALLMTRGIGLDVGTPVASPPSVDALRADCPVSAVESYGSYREVGGPGAFFPPGPPYRADATWRMLVRVPTDHELTPAPRVWATHPALGGGAIVARADAGEIQNVGGSHAPPEQLPGSFYLVEQFFPFAGCWTLYAAIGEEVAATATVWVEREAETADACPPEPSVQQTVLTPEQGGPRAFVAVSEPLDLGYPGAPISVRVFPPIDRSTLLVTGSVLESPDESGQVTTTADLQPAASPGGTSTAASLPGAQYSGNVLVFRPGCWNLRVIVDAEIIGSAVVIAGRASPESSPVPTPMLPATP